MTTVMQTFGMRCPCCKRDNAVDIQAIVWVRLTPSGTELSDDGSHEWGDASTARCNACGWQGRAGDTLIEKTNASNPDNLELTTSAARFSCPAGHTEGLQESHEVHVWLPIDTITGEANYTVALGELESSDIDEDALSDDCFYCPTCNDTFSELVEIIATSKRNRSALTR
jgi:hypothetical protein